MCSCPCGITTVATTRRSRNQISDISALSSLTKLEALDLSRNQIRDVSALSDLKQETHLEHLFLSHNQISDISALSGLYFGWNWFEPVFNPDDPDGPSSLLDLRSNPLDCFAYCSVIPVIEERHNQDSFFLWHDPLPDDCDCAVLPSFRRGDANADGDSNITDAVGILEHLFGSGEKPSCLGSADANDSGTIDIADPVFLLNFLFSGGPQPAEPCGCLDLAIQTIQ